MERTLIFEDNLPVGVEALNVKELPAHYHMDMQIIYVLKGKVDLKLCYFTYSLSAGDMHFVHRNDIHSIRGITDDNLVLLFNMNVDAFASVYPDFYMQIFTTRVSKNFVTYEGKLKLSDNIFNIISEMVEKRRGYQDRIYDMSKEIIRILYKDFRGFYIDSQERIFLHTIISDNMQTDRLSRITNFVYDNYPYKMSLNALAQSEHISKFYLSHLFKKYIGLNFRDFVSMVRAEMSEHQLLFSNMPITRIATECGFSSPKYFIEHFKKWFSYHPTEYRDRFQKNTIEYVEPSVTEISLHELLEYKDVMPMFEIDILDSRNGSESLNIHVKNRETQNVSWKNILEVNADGSLLSNNEFREVYLEFYEVMMGRRVKVNIIDSSIDNKAIDYFKHDPQSFCLNKFNSIIKSLLAGKKTKWRPDFVDSTDAKNGLITAHGFKKPLYYLFMYLSEMYDSIIQINHNYIVSHYEDNIKIIVCNDNSLYSNHLDVIMDGFEGAYKLIELRLSSELSFYEQWKQLDFNSEITEKEKIIINGMSFPIGRFETIPDIKQYVYHCEMKPQELILIDLTRIK